MMRRAIAGRFADNTIERTRESPTGLLGKRDMSPVGKSWRSTASAMMAVAAARRSRPTSRRKAGRTSCFASISRDQRRPHLANAAAVAFYALLALFPAIAALVSIYGLCADPATIEQQLDSLSAILPGGAVDAIRDQLHRLVTQPRGTLGFSFFFGLIVALWSANGG